MAKARATEKVIGIEIPECPVCLERMTSPIFQCQSGHSLCNLCTRSLLPPICPICRQNITQMRNWQLEELVDKAILSCPYKAFGCIYNVKAGEMQEHLKECIFREMDCPLGLVFGRCSWSGKLKEIQNHFRDKHPQNCVLNLDTESDISGISGTCDDRFIFLLSQGQFLFIFTIKVDINQEMAYYVVQHLGSKRNAQQHEYEITVTSKQDSRRKIIFNDHCFNNTYDINDIFAKGLCGIMPLKMLSHFIRNRTLCLKVNIKRVHHFSKNKPQIDVKSENKASKYSTKQPNFRAKSPGPNFRPKGPKSHGTQKMK